MSVADLSSRWTAFSPMYKGIYIYVIRKFRQLLSRCATQRSEPSHSAAPPFRSLIGPASAGQKVHRSTYLSLPFLHMSLGWSPFVERRFQFASRRFFVINLQTAQRRNAKSKREKEKGTEGEIQGDTMPGINERVNKSKEGREKVSERG